MSVDRIRILTCRQPEPATSVTGSGSTTRQRATKYVFWYMGARTEDENGFALPESNRHPELRLLCMLMAPVVTCTQEDV